MIPLPNVLGLIVCEKAIVEEGTKNISLINCFQRLVVDHVPALARPFAVFATLTDGRGSGTIELVVTHVETGAEAYVLRVRVDFPGPLTEVRVLFPIHDCSFPEVGRYQLTLLADGEWLAQRDLQVILTEDRQ
jgi:hypothetical protein